ncbi:MAG: LmbE family protein, partial [Candidatus Nephrothrix sp. EaCA]
INAAAEVNGKTYSLALKSIQYDHIPAITLLSPSALKAVRVNVQKKGKTIAYIKGAGDETPQALRAIGYEVWEMKNSEITLANLQKNDAVVLGIRALNTNEEVRFFMPAVLEYVKQGGTAMMQYNTSPIGFDWDKFSPYPITVSRDRITEEDSEVKILKPESPVFNSPNKITADDFKNWVQERGLYYPSAWDSHFEALLSGHDKGEKALDGGLLTAQYGKGYYVYASLSFFRQTPEGVPGAYKLLANLVSLGK